MSITAPEQPAQKPVISYGSSEWIRLRAEHPETRGANDHQLVGATVQRARDHVVATTDGNGQSGNNADEAAAQEAEEERTICVSRAVQTIMNRIATKMRTLRPKRNSNYRVRDRYAEYVTFLNLAHSGAPARTILCILCESRHKGTKALGKEMANGRDLYTTELSDDALLFSEAKLRAMEEMVDEIFDQQPNPHGRMHPRDAAYEQAGDELFDLPSDADDSSGSAKAT